MREKKPKHQGLEIKKRLRVTVRGKEDKKKFKVQSSKFKIQN